MRDISRWFYVFILLIIPMFIDSNVYAAPTSPAKPTAPQPHYTELSSYVAVNFNPWLYGLTPFIAGPWQIESGDWWIVHNNGIHGGSHVAGIRFKTSAGTRCVIIDWFGPRCVKYISGKKSKSAVDGVKADGTTSQNKAMREHAMLSVRSNSPVATGCLEAKIEFILFHNERVPGTISTLPRQRCDVVYHPGNMLFYNDNYPLVPVGHKISAYNITCAVAADDWITCVNSFHHGFVFATGHDQTF